MTTAEEMHALADAVNVAATAAAEIAIANVKDIALEKLHTAAANGGYYLLLKPGGTLSGYSQVQCDYLVPYLEEHGFAVVPEAVAGTAAVDFALACTW